MIERRVGQGNGDCGSQATANRGPVGVVSE